MKPESPVLVPVRAVDVGYYNVKYSLGRKAVGANSEIATGLFPSLAPRLASNFMMSSAGTTQADGCVVEIEGVRYFVGKDAIYNSSGLESRPVLEDYSISDKYLALLRGALHYIALDAGGPNELVIEQLVLGLPLNTFHKYKDALIARARGEHILGVSSRSGIVGHRRVTVERVQVIVQPQGALINFGLQNRQDSQNGWALVVDPGGGTLDWYLSRGRMPNWQRSGAYPKSMLACANAVADRINGNWKNQFEIIERIDEAIRTGADHFKVGGREYPMADYAQTVDAVVRESVNYMLSVVGATDNLDHVLLTGGGAQLFHDHLLANYPALEPILRVDDGAVYSNVKGFQVAGELFLSNAR